MTRQLEGRVALVTGAATGLGADVAQALAAEGADVIVNYRRSQAAAESLVAAIEATGARAFAVQGDVRVRLEAEDLVAAAVARFGRLHILVNNVGDYHKAPLLSVTPEQWLDAFDSNLHSAFWCIRSSVPHLRHAGWGRIVNLGFASAGRVAAEPLITGYHIAKTGLLALTKTLAQALAADGITVNLVSPGVLESSESKPLADIPAGRLGTHAELIALVLYLLSDSAAYLTGNNLEVAGGWRL